MSNDAEVIARLQDTVEPCYNQAQHNIAHNTAMVKYASEYILNLHQG